MHSSSPNLYQRQLETASADNLLRLAKYLKLKNFYQLPHKDLAFIISMVLSDVYFKEFSPNLDT